MSRILFADDEEHLRRVADQAFRLEGLNAHMFEDAAHLWGEVARDLDGVIVSDIRMPEMSGIELLEHVMEVDPAIPVILITGHGDVELAVQCMRKGAYDFVEKPYEPQRLIEAVRRALDKRALILENRDLKSKLNHSPDFKRTLSGNSQVMENVRRKLTTLGPLDTDVLLMGATGTGKNLVAKKLHEISPRAPYPFVHINCAAIPKDMVEIELFGYEPGAFASAVRSKYGKFEFARGGTVFLDEIEGLDLAVQAKLLSAIHERQITRLGANEPVDLDVRFITASKKDLNIEASEGRFRSDLYYRLAGAEVRLPTLDERPEDIPGIFSELVQRASLRHQRDMPHISDHIFQRLIARRWPGNVRELLNVAERFVLGLDLEIADTPMPSDAKATLSDQMAQFERAAIASSLTSHGGKINATHLALGISRKALYDKMQKYGLNRDDFGS